MMRPIVSDCAIENVSKEEYLKHFWHSSSHVLGSAIERVYPGALLTVGPAVK